MKRSCCLESYHPSERSRSRLNSTQMLNDCNILSPEPKRKKTALTPNSKQKQSAPTSDVPPAPEQMKTASIPDHLPLQIKQEPTDGAPCYSIDETLKAADELFHQLVLRSSLSPTEQLEFSSVLNELKTGQTGPTRNTRSRQRSIQSYFSRTWASNSLSLEFVIIWILSYSYTYSFVNLAEFIDLIILMKRVLNFTVSYTITVFLNALWY